jgi:hypothetical protein
MRERSAGMSAAALLACLATGWAGGCATPRPSHGPAVSVAAAAPEGGPGGSWEVVFPGGDTGPALASGPEASRLDYLVVRESSTVLDQRLWPEPRAESLHRLRRIYFRGHPGEVPYYRTAPAWQSPSYPQFPWGW